MKISPHSDVVIIRRLPPNNVSDGGLQLVFDADYKEDIGIIEFVGKGRRRKCNHCGHETTSLPAVKAGDKVLFSTNGHQITVLNGQEFVVLRENSIIGVIEE